MEDEVYTATRIGRCDCAVPAENPAEELTLGLNPNNGTGPGIPGIIVNPLDGSPKEVNPSEEEEEIIVTEEKNFRLLMDEENTIQFCGHTLHRIECTKEFVNQFNVHVGDKGGFVESENNIHENGWVSENAKVLENAIVTGHAHVSNQAIVAGRAYITGYANVTDRAQIYASAFVGDNAYIGRDASVTDNAQVAGSACVTDRARIQDQAIVKENAHVGDDANIRDNAVISGGAIVHGTPLIGENACIKDESEFIVFENVGSRHDVLIAYKTKYCGVRIKVGCFLGSLDEFKIQTLKTHKNNEKVKNEYLLILEVIKNRFEINI